MTRTHFLNELGGDMRAVALTQAELGRFVGVSEGTVYDLERGRQNPPSPPGLKIAEALAIRTD